MPRYSGRIGLPINFSSYGSITNNESLLYSSSLEAGRGAERRHAMPVNDERLSCSQLVDRWIITVLGCIVFGAIGYVVYAQPGAIAVAARNLV